MIRALHALKRHEEGQALVLACISMLVLCICLLATVNLTYAAKERIELQNSADAAAYTTAGVQARALNFMAYSNRAMTVHYTADMNMLADITYLAFCIMIVTAFENIPWIGWIFAIAAEIMGFYFDMIYVFAAGAIPFIDGLNYGMAAMQAAVSNEIGAQLVSMPTSLAQQSNPKYQGSALTNVLLNVAPTQLGVNNVVNTNLTPSLGIVAQPGGSNSVLDRLLMTEIANSNRNQWTAHGVPPPSITLGLFPRKWGPGSFNLVVISVNYGKVARTEWGSMLAGGVGGGLIGGILNGLTGGIFNPTEQVYSDDYFYITANINLGVVTLTLGFYIRATAWADRNLIGDLFGILGLGATGPSMNATFSLGASCQNHVPLVNACSWFPFDLWADPGYVVAIPLSIASAAMSAEVTEDMQTVISSIPIFHFGQTPYARFIPQQHVASQGQFQGLFNQPPVVLMVTAPQSYLESKGGPFMLHSTFQNGFLKAGTVGTGTDGTTTGHDADYYASVNKSPSKRGFVNSVDFRPGDTPYPWMTVGFHAISAAMAYYHRPGDWREPPNLFNPFWAAKLMPVGDYPTIQTNAAFTNLFTANQMVH